MLPKTQESGECKTTIKCWPFGTRMQQRLDVAAGQFPPRAAVRLILRFGHDQM